MKQKEMSVYLKIITVIVAILFLFFIIWFLPTSIIQTMIPAGIILQQAYFIIGYIWLVSTPCLLALVKFYKICCRIGKDNSFCTENAKALKDMSFFMLTVVVLSSIGMAVLVFSGLYYYFKFSGAAILIAIIIAVTLSVVCAALSHLVQKASALQEEHDLTV